MEVHDREHGMQTTFAATALRRAIDFRETLVVNATDETLPWLHIDVFEGRGLSQIVIAPPLQCRWPSQRRLVCKQGIWWFHPVGNQYD